MLCLAASRSERNCEGLTRRELLRVGTLSLGGLSLSTLLSLRSHAATVSADVKDTSVVLLFLTGGAPQIETFDPKMSAPSEFRSINGEVSTTIPGITFGGMFPQLARRAHRLAVIRSFSHGESDHTKAVERVIRGGNPANAGMGVLVSRYRGAHSPTTGFPTHVHLNSLETDSQFNKEKDRLLRADGPGDFGGALAPFQPGAGSEAAESMLPHVPILRLDDRRELLERLDRISREIDADGNIVALDEFSQRAFKLILGKSKATFDLSQEDPKLVERYDTSRFNTGISKYRRSTLGHQLLLARRLCEAGCGFVTVHNPGWDLHGGGRHYDMPRGMAELGPPVDHAVSAFLDDVERRGLSDKILLVVTGEFGRTPKVNARAGRDHWPRLSTLAFAGGGLKMGQAIGRSTARAEEPDSRPVTIEDLLATILEVLVGIDAIRQNSDVPRNIASAVERGTPIAELF